MVVFDQLRTSDDSSKLYINVHVNEASYFENITLKELIITTADHVSQTAPEMPAANTDYIYKYTFASNLKTASFVLDKASFDAAYTHTSTDGSTATIKLDGDLSSYMFFVYVRVQGEPDPCTPCELDKEYTLGVTFDDNPFYNQVMQYTRELADTCEIPKGFIDLILRWQGLNAAINTGNYLVANDFWKMLFMNNGNNRINNYGTFKPCGCHG